MKAKNHWQIEEVVRTAVAFILGRVFLLIVYLCNIYDGSLDG